MRMIQGRAAMAPANVALAMSHGAGLLLATAVSECSALATTGATPTPSREGRSRPVVSPQAVPTSVDPLPALADQASAAAMAAEAAATMIASGDPSLVERGRHWEPAATALRERGARMVIAATSGGQVHDPDEACEFAPRSLQAGGVSMAGEGQAMVDHGREMAEQVMPLRRDAALSPELAADLIASADGPVTTGEALVRDGEVLQADADRLLESIGR